MASSPQPPDLVAFDVDGTLVEHPRGWTVWEVLNDRFCGGSGINRERYAAFKAGRLRYADWVALDVAGWRTAGVRRDDLVQAMGSLRLVSGTREALAELRRAGVRLVVISGTVDLMLQTLYPEHPFEEIHANRIEFDDRGRITGWRATPYDMQGKARALREIAARMEVPLARTAFVGDSENDRWVAEIAGTTVALNPRCAELERHAAAVVRASDLRAILPYLLPGHEPDRTPAGPDGAPK